MSTHQFIVGTRFRWQEKTYEVRPSSAENTLTLREVLTKQETNVDMRVLAKALFEGTLFFITREQSMKSIISTSSNSQTEQPTLSDYSEYQSNIALYRLQVISPLLKMQPKERSREMIRDYVTKLRTERDEAFVGSLLGSVSVNSIYNWIRSYINGGYDIRSLVPNTKRRGGKDKLRLDAGVDALINATIQELYKRPEAISIDDVVQEVACRVQEINISHPERKALILPSRSTVARRIEALGAAERFAIRYGRRLARQKFSQYGQNEYPEMPTERVEIDHTRADFIVIDDQDSLPLGRPTLTYCIDMATRYPLGYYIGFEPPSYLSVMECLYHAISPKEGVREKYRTEHDWIAYGIPSNLVIDNGREFIGRDLSDACLSLGIVLQQTPVRTPHFKAGIERHFGTLNTMLFHTLPGTTFSSPQDRGDYNSVEQACVYLSDVEKILHTFILDIYAENFHKGLKGIPARRWEEALQSGFLPTLPQSLGELQVLLGRVTKRVIRSNGVDFVSLRYNCDDLIDVRTKLKGEEVKIKYNPGDLSHIYVFDPFIKQYLKVPALDQEYTRDLSLWKHTIIRQAVPKEQDKADPVALGQAKRKVREIFEAGRERKRVATRSRMTRWETSGKPLHRVNQNTNASVTSSSATVPELQGALQQEVSFDEGFLASEGDDGWEIDYSLSKEV